MFHLDSSCDLIFLEVFPLYYYCRMSYYRTDNQKSGDSDEAGRW